MYKKIWGLEELQKMRFPVPSFQVIDISSDKPSDLREYLLNKIDKLQIPNAMGERIGVTIRVSMPGPLDKIAKHGGLHIIEKEEVLRRINEKYHQYGPTCKIIIQHTVDARCSGAILREGISVTVETVPEDAPPLLEGFALSYEQWILSLETFEWKKEKNYSENGKETEVLTYENLKKLERYITSLPDKSYLEWSISKNGKPFFYEYCKLNNQPE
jgi:hypothetical protein